MILPEVPGIVEAAMAIAAEPDGRVSFRVVVGADGGQSAGYDLVELIISPEHVERALAGMKIGAPTGIENSDELSTFPCHIGLYRGAGHAAA
jgi:hypothetical protein